ncbi:hypothetical protein [Leptolyngbya sp. NIES-2104]|uniref:hypothetical protein n=1 Tax=Leptolyngbya sp. NIES-2104 TaxID=1552121 RepID=UPI0006EC9555|nr:hypothetical protein [Leptolyngbya sp. NIES-2104]GAP99647.1 hypothetical protein NIES2104_62130 [Leptolyngbya sp. NIES-2104]
MLRRIAPAAFILLSACSALSRTPTQSSNSPSASLPDIQCRGEVPAALQKTFGDLRLAQPNDFIPVIQKLEQQSRQPNRPKISYTCSIFSTDFNQDQQQDYAVLLVNPQTQTSQFRLAINQGNQTFKSAIVRDYPRPPAGIRQPVYVAMLLKRSGEQGPANREYFPLKRNTPEREAFIAQPAIEVWRSPNEYKARTASKLSAIKWFNQAVGYGSEIFYFSNGELKTIGVAD